MVEIQATTSGPLFDRALDVNVRSQFRIGLQRIGEAQREAGRKQLGQRSRFRTAKYGHAAESLRTKVTRVGGDDYEVATFIGGPAAFLGHILERGTKGHAIPRVRVRGSGSRRRIVRGGKILAFNGVFRRAVEHPGTPAYHWAERATAEIARTAPDILAQAFAGQLDG